VRKATVPIFVRRPWSLDDTVEADEFSDERFHGSSCARLNFQNYSGR